MPAIEFPRRQLGSLHELASRVLEGRELGCDRDTLARELLAGFFDVCERAGLDGVLAALERASPPLELTDRSVLPEQRELRAALVAALERDLDDGGPRNAKPRVLADAVVAALSLTLTDAPDRTVTLGDDVGVAIKAALASVVDVDLAAPQLRATIIADARARCDARHVASFDRIAAQLDDRGMRMVRQPKLPLDAVQAVQGYLADARRAVVARTAGAAIDRATGVLAGVAADAAARIDRPITLRLTPRDVAIRRACEARVPKVPAAVVLSLFESLTELLELAWRAPERPVRAYSPAETFAVGDLIDHPKFGRGSVTACAVQRIEVEFADGPHTLVVRPSK